MAWRRKPVERLFFFAGAREKSQNGPSEMQQSIQLATIADIRKNSVLLTRLRSILCRQSS